MSNTEALCASCGHMRWVHFGVEPGEGRNCGYGAALPEYKAFDGTVYPPSPASPEHCHCPQFIEPPDPEGGDKE